jgi:septal ring factor EnvC (AmiA/AmiB activator)
MAAMNEAFWASLDAQIIANRPENRGDTAFSAASAAADGTTAVGPDPTQTVRTAADWTGVLDTLTAAKSAAQSQEVRLREQAAQQDATLQDLRRAQQELQAYETLLREVRAQSETKIRELEVRAENRLREVEAEARSQLDASEARTRAAEARAEAAEDWLRRIEQASRDLLPSDHRAAA